MSTQTRSPSVSIRSFAHSGNATSPFTVKGPWARDSGIGCQIGSTQRPVAPSSKIRRRKSPVSSDCRMPGRSAASMSYIAASLMRWARSMHRISSGVLMIFAAVSASLASTTVRLSRSFESSKYSAPVASSRASGPGTGQRLYTFWSGQMQRWMAVVNDKLGRATVGEGGKEMGEVVACDEDCSTLFVERVRRVGHRANVADPVLDGARSCEQEGPDAPCVHLRDEACSAIPTHPCQVERCLVAVGAVRLVHVAVPLADSACMLTDATAPMGLHRSTSRRSYGWLARSSRCHRNAVSGTRGKSVRFVQGPWVTKRDP